nr:MAG TPA_asm: hypothetical protein [Caudoviricetes sp.]
MTLHHSSVFFRGIVTCFACLRIMFCCLFTRMF